jgi:hypothetical protein
MGNTGSISKASWPAYSKYDASIHAQYDFFKDFFKVIRESSQKSKIKGRKAVNIFCVSTYDENKRATLLFLQSKFNAQTKSFPPKDVFAPELKAFIESTPELKKDFKNLMQFASFYKGEAEERGLEALATEMSFDQESIIAENADYLKKCFDLEECRIFNVNSIVDPKEIGEKDRKIIDNSKPSKPTHNFIELK